MTITDWVLLAVVAVSAVLGLVRGFVGVLASLAAWILAGWAAFRFGARLAVAMAGGAEPGASELFGGYAISFLVVLVVVGLVGWGVRKLVHGVGLSGVDRFLGLGLGLARGVLVACLIVLLMGFTELPEDRGWRESRTLAVFLPGALLLRGLLPDWAAAHANFEPAIDPLVDPATEPATGAAAPRT